MTEYQVTYWRELPSMVVAREGDATVIKSQLAQRFQDAIDDAAMRLGETGADAYLAGWARGEWTPAEGGGTEVCDRVVAELEKQWPDARLTEYLDGLEAAP
ncbi:virulence factor [Nocardioides sp.]|uniref:virulence factor n=1 Tax=Nocardioides sp. TaxID=35761 RepID=UPI002F428963